MGDECDKQLNLGNFVFDEENHERKSWKFFGRTYNRSLLVFMCQFFVIVLILACAIVRIMLSTIHIYTAYIVVPSPMQCPYLDHHILIIPYKVIIP